MENENKQQHGASGFMLFDSFREFTELEFFSKDFFIKHWKRVLIITLLLFTYISNRFSCIKMMAEIQSLKSELIDIRYEALTRSSELIGISRPSQVKELVRKNGIEIEESDKPAYNLND
ncbi:MAG: FtsL-like putative cell division protein [Bacteroidales bacterium]